MPTVHNNNEGAIHFRNNQSGKRITLPRGITKITDEEFKLFEEKLGATRGVNVVHEIKDTPAGSGGAKFSNVKDTPAKEEAKPLAKESAKESGKKEDKQA